MICKVVDGDGVTHYRIVGWSGNWHACDPDDCRGRPASWRRPVDCMACVAMVTRLPDCPHSAGNVVRVVSHAQDYWFLVRCCTRCTDETRVRHA